MTLLIVASLSILPVGDKEHQAAAAAAATNPSAPPDVAERLARDEDSYVRDVLAHNPACPPETAEHLGVRETPDEAAAYRAGLEDVHPVALAALADHPNAEVRASAAFNSHTTASTLTRLAGDPSVAVRVVVATNEHCPAQALGLLVSDLNQEVRDHALDHSNLNEATRRRLADAEH